ncbi:MAG: WD40 repeat domain-containing protein [Bacteroidota bacterium]
MKQRNPYLLISLLVLSSLLLDACSFSVEVMNNHTNNYTEGVSTPTPDLQIDPTPAPTMPLTPTEVPAMPTPTRIPLQEGTVSMLETFMYATQKDIVHGLAFTPDGTVLASAGGNGGNASIYLWDVANNQPLGTLDGHDGIIWDIAFSPNGEMLASVSGDRTLKVWDWRNKTVIYTQSFPGQVSSVVFSPDGQSLAVGGEDELKNQIQHAAAWTYSVGSWQPLVKFPEFINVAALAYSPHGGTLVGGGTSRNVQVWQAGDGTPVYTLSHAHQVLKAAISPDGSTLATATCITVANYDCLEGGVWLWNLPTGKLIQKLGGFPNVVESVAFTADGSNLVVGSRDGTLRFYPTTNYVSAIQFQSPGGISAMALSPDGGLLATGNGNGDVYVWKNVYHP